MADVALLVILWDVIFIAGRLL